MRRIVNVFVTGVACLLACACAISPGPEVMGPDRCGFTRHEVVLSIPGDRTAPPGESDFAAAIRRAYPASPGTGDGAVSPSMLFLSGGSEDGAFGAGYLDGWARSYGGLPAFRIVTGISTGAILSTAAFIGDADMLRRYADYYGISGEEEVLHPFVGSGSDNGLGVAIAAATRGSVASLAPLRAQLQAELDDDTLARVAEGGAQGRRLYVGVVDVDSAAPYAFDMTAMAASIMGAKGQQRARLRNCYVDAIIASSSVPFAALPTFIDNRMYVDGGIGFTVFSDAMIQLAEDWKREAAGGAATPGGPPHGSFIYAIVNQGLTVEETCRTEDAAMEACPDAGDPYAGRHRRWSLLDLADRSLEIFINQLFRSSVHALHSRAAQADPGSAEPFVLRLAYLRPEVEDWSFAMDDPALGAGARTCGEWEAEDRRIDDPLEFHPRYMHCLVAYGRAMAARDGW